MKKLLIILAALFLVFTSCDTTDPKPPEEKPPGYQEDIPWPSLADSPWPMNHGNPQATGRSKLPGPILGEKVWDFGIDNEFFCGISIGPDSTIYAVSNDTLGNTLYAFKPNGEIKFKTQIADFFRENFNTPLVRNDGSIIVSNYRNSIFAISPSGSILWEYKFEKGITSESIGIDKEGNLYFVSRNRFVALTPDGKFDWEINDSRIYCLIVSVAISFSPDGKTAYLPGCENAVIAISIEDQNIKWVYGNRGVTNSIIVDSYGNIYFEYIFEGHNKVKFVSLSPIGTLNWETDIVYNGDSADNTSSIDRNGNLYFGSDTLYSVDYIGNFRWKIGLDGICDAPIICDEYGTIYVTSTTMFSINVYAISIEGNIKWIYSQEVTFGTAGSAAISFNESLIVPVIYNGKIIYIK